MSIKAKASGMQPTPGRRYIYIEIPLGCTGAAMFDEIGPVIKEWKAVGKGPNGGGLMYDDCHIKCPDGREFVSVTFRGDLDSWQALIESFASSRALALGAIRADTFEISDGIKVPLSACEITTL